MSEPESKKSISWEIHRTKERERSRSFYVAVLVCMILFLTFAVWQKNFLFGVFVIVATGIVLFLSQQQPEAYSFTLTDESFIVGDDEHSYDLSSFSHFDIFRFEDNDFELFLVPRERFKPIVRVRIWPADKERIVSFLTDILPRKKTEPSFLDIFSKFIGI